MKALFWVQHLLGTGHVKRAVIVARAMRAEGFEVTLVCGGPPAPWLVPPDLQHVQLAAIRANDLTFSQLLGPDDRPVDQRLWDDRRAQLLALLADLRPRVLLTEMFPFGRRAFRAELVPLLTAAAMADPPIWRVASVRDILVTKPAPENYAWMRDLAQAHYDRVLVHTDPDLVPFDLTFPYAAALADRLESTGYVIGPPPPAVDEGHGEILVSAGGGRVGGDLLDAALDARSLSAAADRPWRLIAGGGFDPVRFDRLARRCPDGVRLERQRSDFEALLANSLLSVSQAGYNTVVEGLRVRKPMVLVPFETDSETEQTIRAERLAERGLANVVRESELTPKRLAAAIDAMLGQVLPPSAVALDGATNAARLVARLAAGSPPSPAGGTTRS